MALMYCVKPTSTRSAFVGVPSPSQHLKLRSKSSRYIPIKCLLSLRRHEEYRGCLIDHLLAVTLRHWDPAMREIGAQSLRCICELDLVKLGPDVAKRAVRNALLLITTPSLHSTLLRRRGCWRYPTTAMSMVACSHSQSLRQHSVVHGIVINWSRSVARFVHPCIANFTM